MMMMKLPVRAMTLAIGLLGLGGIPAFAQGTAVRGTVVNGLSREPVMGATISLEELSRDARSAADGGFVFDNVPAGTYHVRIQAERFAATRSEIVVGAAPLTVPIELTPDLHYAEVVSVSPDRRDPFDSYQPTTVLGGQELEKDRQSTLGETLQYEAGIAMRSQGPGPSRPVIRGLDGDRVLILQDGQRMGDLSSQSGDHGVNINPGSASRIEVVRGPATLLYGANAIGGLVNVISDELPKAPVTAAHGSVSFDAGSAASEAGGAASVTVGNGRFALHAGGSGRRAGDYDTPQGTVPNSFARGGFAGVGASWTGSNGYLGASYGYDRTHYGVPLVEEGETNLDPRRQVFRLQGERRDLGGFFDSVRGSVGITKYRHDELDGEEIATRFKNDTSEVELLANHRSIGRMKGSIGASLLSRAFDTAGEESLSPAVDQKGYASFVYEEVTANPHLTFQFGGRAEHASFDPQGGEVARDFTNLSGSLGLLVHPSEATTVAFSLARAARNPALEELYFHGPHAGNFAVENGDSSLESEQASGFDASFRWRGSRASGEVTYFLNAINNFIFRGYSGAVEDDLPVTFFTAGDARLQGIESHLDLALSRLVSVEGGLDYVRGALTSSDVPLPRMPPLRGRLGLRVQKNAFQAGGDAIFTAKQDRIFTTDGPDGPIGETATDGSNLLKLFAAYSFGRGPAVSTLTFRLDNATNELYRNHLNYLKDLIPEVGRNFKVLYSLRF